MTPETEIAVLRAKLDSLALRISNPTSLPVDIHNSIRRIERSLRQRRRSAEEQLEYFQAAEAEGEELCADYLSALHFELVILNRLDELLFKLVDLTRHD